MTSTMSLLRCLISIKIITKSQIQIKLYSKRIVSLESNMPINYKEYHPKWSLISRLIRFKRADNKCEKCGLPNYSVGFRDNQGVFNPVSGTILHDMAGQGLHYPSLMPLTYKQAKQLKDAANENSVNGEKYIIIVLTVAHLDHDKSNNKFSNLKALCQKCHLDLDLPHHINNRKFGRNWKKDQTRLDL